MIRRIFIAAVCICLLSISSTAWGRTKIDPFLGAGSKLEEFKALTLSRIPPTSQETEVFIKTTDPELTSDAVAEAGGRVRTSSGSIITASLPLDAVAAIAEDPEVIYIEAAKPIERTSDVALEEIGAGEVHGGLNLPSGYSGSGIIIGIVDTGVDFRHADFTDSEGRSRVLAIWDQGKSIGQGPSEISNTYGMECDVDSIAEDTCPLSDADGHGTHVAGIATSGDDKYRGVAPDANIIVVKYDARLDLESGYADTIFSTKICEAAYYVFAKAEQYGMPAVVNMSLGTHIGAHDGTSLFEECLGSLTDGAAGRAIVAAAGNEYSGDWNFTGIHAGFDLTESPQATNFVIRNPTSDGIYYIDLWGDAGSDLSVALAVHSGAPAGQPLEVSDFVALREKKSGSFLDGKVDYMINALEDESALNGKPHVGIRIFVDPAYDDVKDNSFDLVVRGSGSFDAWLFPDKPARTIQFTSVSGRQDGEWTYVAGDRENNIAIPATSPNVLAVAGYVTRTRWTVGSLTWIFNGQQLGELLSFSSSGPTSDPSYTGHKPDLSAPGGMIASAKSSLAQVGSQVVMGDGEHYLQSGTSMAAPFVSGTIALMFEANPNFTQEDARRILIESAYTDSSTTSVPHDRWGYGKLDVLRAMEIAVTAEASGAFDANGSISAPSGSQTAEKKSSCQLAAGSDAPLMAIDLLLFACFAACIFMRRKSRAALP